MLNFQDRTVKIETSEGKVVVNMLPYSFNVTQHVDEEPNDHVFREFSFVQDQQLKENTSFAKPVNVDLVYYVREVLVDYLPLEEKEWQYSVNKHSKNCNLFEKTKSESWHAGTVIIDADVSLCKNEKDKTMDISNVQVSLLPEHSEIANNNTESSVTSTTSMEDSNLDYVATSTEIIDMVNSLTHLSKSEINMLSNLLLEFRTIFSKKPGRCNKYEYVIQVNSKEPVVRRPYPIPKIFVSNVRKQLQLLESWGIIEKCQSIHLNPLVIIVKKNKDLRICVDFRLLNQEIHLQQVRTEKNR